MIRINLLPLAERPSAIPYFRVSLFFVALLVVILACISVAVGFRTSLYERDIAQLENRYEELRPVRLAMEQAGDKQNIIDKKLEMVKRIVKLQTHAYLVMPHIASMMNDKIWLNETKVNQTVYGKIELVGETVQYPELANFIKRLEAEKSISSVTLKSTDDNKHETIKFTIELKIKEM